MLPTKFQISWPFLFMRRSENGFQDGHHGGHLGILLGTTLSFFDLQVTPIEKKRKQSFKMTVTMAILDFGSERF